MPKNIKRILIAAGAVVVLVLAIIVVRLAFPKQEEIPVETPVPTETPVYYISRRSSSEVSGLHFLYDDGEHFDILIEANENGTYNYTCDPEDDFFGYNAGSFRSMMFSLATLTATSKIEDEPTDLQQYGLDEPRMTVTIDFTDGTTTTLIIGNETPIQGYYYIMSDKENTVYTIGGYITSLIMRRPFEYRQIDTFPSYSGDEVYTNIVRFILTQRDGTPVEVLLDRDLSMEGNITSSAYMMVQPFVSPCTTDTVEALLDILSTITFDSIIADIGASELAAYGLDKPARMYIEDLAGNSLELVIGTANSNLCYAVIARQYDAFMAGELNYLTVLQFTETDFNWITMNYMNLQIRTPWIINIHDVESVSYCLNGESYEMVLYEYDDVTGSGVDVIRVCSYINGHDVGNTNTKRIFSRTLNFRQVAYLPEGTSYDKDYSNSIVIHMKDGTEQTMNFHSINARQYACELNGVAEFYIYASNLNNIQSALDRALDDREVSLVYTR